jgi:SPP1 gp7 family putative phage head morphogenesis protein
VPINSIPEDEAAKVVAEAVKEAINGMRETALARLASGGVIDTAWQTATFQALRDLADKFALDIVNGKWGEFLVDAAIAGGKSTGIDGALAMISKDQIEMALFNSKVQIQGLLEDGVKEVNRIIAKAMVTGKPLDEIAAQIQETVTIDGDVIDMNRADLIARNELFSAYRQESFRIADDAGYDLFEMTGPVDKRISEICFDNVGKIMSAEDWETLDPDVFSYGLHINCRHAWDPVLSDAAATD